MMALDEIGDWCQLLAVPFLSCLDDRDTFREAQQSQHVLHGYGTPVVPCVAAHLGRSLA